MISKRWRDKQIRSLFSVATVTKLQGENRSQTVVALKSDFTGQITAIILRHPLRTSNQQTFLAVVDESAVYGQNARLELAGKGDRHHGIASYTQA